MLWNMQDQRQPTYGERVEQAFAARVRDYRVARGWSQTSFAQILERFGLKLDGTAITRLEKNAETTEGARSIRLGEAVVISRALRVPLDEMLQITESFDDQYARAKTHWEVAKRNFSASQKELGIAEQRLAEMQELMDQRSAEKQAAVALSGKTAMRVDQKKLIRALENSGLSANEVEKAKSDLLLTQSKKRNTEDAFDRLYQLIQKSRLDWKDISDMVYVVAPPSRRNSGGDNGDG